MATTSPTKTATVKTATAKTETQPTEPKGVGIREVAAHLATEPRTLRAYLRRTNRAIGRGSRYTWPSLKDPAVVKLAADWKAAKEKPAAEIDQ